MVVVEVRSAEDFSIIYTYDGKEIFLDKSLKYFLPNVKMPKKRLLKKKCVYHKKKNYSTDASNNINLCIDFMPFNI